ncbi:putative voltage-gated K+ channel beta subunit [Gonapodya prolifera JEL478]|uniref:Putative voltage-gated K+ channel beta subunit n=1 Tax=Gonapodya prolifera (strain JEL478) TaxID=1344416 RepID=A0A139APK5_GONPJ|nr:putative voltage-gated K+ channel beta subunit [Gonapodya prolifera JEL478]|eukprot:KXS18691.1 putative voltage-gated K+ channel beta subunit [Gonapodya prolifera JEL478]
MEYRRLGNSGIRVSALSLGGWVTYGGQVGQDSTTKCMEAAWQLGCNFFDTAEGYARGASEVEMGKAIKELGIHRDDVVVSTKIFWGVKGGPNAMGLSRKHLIEGTKASLQRLGMDYVDLLFAHRPDPTVPMEETVRAFNHIIDHGLAFYWGTSEWSASELLEAHRIAKHLGMVGPTMEQPQYNVFARERVEKEYLPIYDTHGLGLTIWSPLASGVLTGKYKFNEPPPPGSRFAVNKDPGLQAIARRSLQTTEAKERLQKVDALAPIAQKIGATLPQLAIAWCLKNPRVSTIITGASRPEQVRDNFGALTVVNKLNDEVVKEIEGVLKNKPKSDPVFRL